MSMSSSQQKDKEQDEIPKVFKNTQEREKKYWQYIDLVVPSGGETDLSSNDATEINCHKCKMKMKLVAGSSKEVSRRVKKFHPEDLESFHLLQEGQLQIKKPKFGNFFS
jgi:hypothetical protein